MPSITLFGHLTPGCTAWPHLEFLPAALQGGSLSSLRLMGTGEGISLVFKAVSKPYWEAGQSCSDLLPACLPRFPSQGDEAGGTGEQPDLALTEDFPGAAFSSDVLVFDELRPGERCTFSTISLPLSLSSLPLITMENSELLLLCMWQSAVMHGICTGEMKSFIWLYFISF